MIKVSVIVPMLNSIRYIEECMNSIISQDLKDIEIICVDAGSTDGTVEYLNRIIEGNGRIKLVHASKKSYGYQMNIGIEQASGEYIGIVESDDIIPREMYSELYDVAKKYELDFVKADFFRFVGEPGKRQFFREKLSPDDKYYNKVLNLSENQKCFSFPINTWSGIYKKAFLSQNHIKHNETPGASFQDNGFWFQTFIYAKRGYFLPKAYYMNRRDNEMSSVFNPDKIFCIPEEYAFIEKILRGQNGLLDHFKYVYTMACLRTYLWTLKRIRYKDKKKFLERFHKDFTRFFHDKMLNIEMFSHDELSVLTKVIYDHEVYYEEKFEAGEEFFEDIKQCSNIAIYGAGKYGDKLWKKINYELGEGRVKYYIVSSMAGNDIEHNNVPVMDLDTWLDKHFEDFIIVMGIKNYKEIIKDHNMGSSRVIIPPAVIFD